MRYLARIVLISLSFESIAGGAIVDDRSKLAFTYDNVTAEVAQQQLAQCQSIATQTTSEVADTTSGSALRGAAKGAAAGATVGAVSGNSGSNGAKIGASVGLLTGRVSGKRAQQHAIQQNEEQYKLVMRNCMLDQKYVALN